MVNSDVLLNASNQMKASQMNKGSELLTPKEVADTLRLEVRGVYDIVRSGKLKAHKFGHRTLRVKRSDLQAYIEGSACYIGEGS